VKTWPAPSARPHYTGPEADNLCYAIRKKNASVLRQHEEKFKAGAKKKGIPAGVVDQVFAAFEPFARYGFNKAHATCYGLIAYQTAYLKANYPVEFMTAVLNGFRERAEKVAAVVAECRRLGIDVRPPDVQRSHALFEVETDADGTRAIRFGMAAVKNVGEGAVESIVAAREAADGGGAFTSLDDLCRRVDPQRVNKRVFESLIKVNALASLGPMTTLLDRIDSALDAAARHHRDVAAGQSTLFDLFAVPMAVEPVPNGSLPGLEGRGEISRRERLRWEKELLGLYLTEHPLGDIADQLPEYVTAYTGELAEESDQSRVTLGGIIQSSRRVITRAGSTMLVVQLEDLQGSVEVVVFPKVFAETANSWADDAVVLVSGRVDHRDEEAKLLCDVVHAWDDAERLGPAAYGAERDRLTRSRGSRPTASVTAQAPAEAPVGLTTPSDVPLVRPRGAEPPAPVPVPDEPPAPADARPLPAVAEGVAGSLWISFAPDLPADALLDAIESVTSIVKQRPGALPVVLAVPVAGATRQVRLPQATGWDEGIEAVLRREVGPALSVERRPESGVPSLSSGP
jgi:DNA polymerase-3 subunit alpha